MRFLLPSHHWADRDAGAAGADLNLANALRQRGHRAESLFFDDVPLRYLKGTRWAPVAFPWLLALRLLRAHARTPFDVIESTAGDLWFAEIMFSVFRRKDHPLLAVRTHGLEHVHAQVSSELARESGMSLSLRYRAYHGGFRLWEVGRDVRRSALVIVHNAADKQYAVDKLHIAENKIHVIHLGISQEFFQKAYQPDCQREGVLFVGSWQVRKGSDLLPGIFQHISTCIPAVPLTLAGVQKPEEEVRRAFSAQVASRLTILPVVPHESLPSLMSRHSVFVFPSRCEGFGLVLIEAMARGMVVVTSPVGVAPEVMRSGWNGFVISKHSADAFAEAVVSALRQGERLEPLRENARATAQEFSWERAARTREILYGRVLGKLDAL